MNSVDTSVREFSIAFYPPALLSTILFITALVLTIAALSWLGMRFYLHRYGVLTEGRVSESSVKISQVSTGEFSASKRSYTHYLTIQFTGPDGIKRTVKGTRYSFEGDDSHVNGTVPVLYSPTHPDIAMFYDRLWHYIVPVASSALALFFLLMTAGLCYGDIRTMNSLSLSDWSDHEFDNLQSTIIECSDAIYHNADDANAYEKRGDAQFAIVQFDDAISDYTAALRLHPERRDLLLKRAKAEWLNGRDYDAVRDWLKSF